MTNRVLVAGETLIDFIPEEPGDLTEIERFRRRPGGAPANVAVGLARLEEPPLFWTRLSTDPFGDLLADTLASEGIPDRFVERDAEAKTTLAFVSHDADADRSFSFHRHETADTRFRAGTVPMETLEACEWVHAGGVTLSTEPARSATLDLLERAGEAGCTVSFDPNARPELWANDAEYRQVCRWGIEEADVLKATTGELRGLGVDGEGPEELARSACELGPHTVLLTRGSAGAFAYGSERAPASGVADHTGYDADVVDTTGAGDAFLAGAIATLVDGEGSLESVLAFANAVAARTTEATGGMTALPSREAVRERFD